MSCIRIEITLLHLRVVGVNWGFDSSKYPFYWLRYTLLSKTAFATVKSPIDTGNSSNTK